MATPKYYVVWVGRKPGIYSSWEECQEQTSRFPNAKFKSFQTMEEAVKAFQAGYESDSQNQIDLDSISVDVGCSGNPGVVEYKGVDTKTGETLFYRGPIQKGTNNLGEFLAIVHALAYLKKRGSDKTIYSDSSTAIGWVREKKVKSSLVRDETTREIWELVDRALLWLKNNSYQNKILKWNTEEWGEIKADFGRK
jgi:ribonuclease HI